MTGSPTDIFGVNFIRDLIAVWMRQDKLSAKAYVIPRTQATSARSSAFRHSWPSMTFPASLHRLSTVQCCNFNSYAYSFHRQLKHVDSEHTPTLDVLLSAGAIFDQLIDHSATSDYSTFSQRVQVNTMFYKPGGPLFIIQGDESSEMLCMEQFEFARWAPEFGAALMSIEHRYFGRSLPFGNNSYTTENFRFLTLDNVMSDSVAIVDWWRTNVTNGAGKDSPVIVFGGSYGGSLSTFFRINHPETFFGAVASAGVVRAFLPVTDDPDRFNRYGLLSQYWLDHAPDAAMKVQQGFQQLQAMVDAGDSTGIAQAMAVCTPPKTEEGDAFFRALAGIFDSLLVADAQFIGPVFNITGFPWDVVANRTLAAPSPLAAVNETINTFCHSQIATSGCFEWPQQCDDSTGTELAPFAYIKCSYLNFDPGDVAPGTIFAATAPFDSTPTCQQMFNITPPTRTELFAKYHFDEATIRNTTRMIHSQGGADPVQGIAPDESWFQLAPTDPDTPRYVYADFAAHTQDLITSLLPGNDDSSLLRARNALDLFNPRANRVSSCVWRDCEARANVDTTASVLERLSNSWKPIVIYLRRKSY
ncbi:serine carboxypeptidase S28-domain-containing protein [Mycena crocata]|nr:serine carboxypeptidase S28-domain-containing protein [Mycena crocata]